MVHTSETAKILVVSNNPSINQAVRKTLAKVDHLYLINQEGTSGKLFSIIAETEPKIILLDFEFQPKPFQLIQAIVSKFPMIALVTILPSSEMEHVDRVVLSGARAFIQYPFSSEKLVATINSVINLMNREQGGPSANPVQENYLNPNNTFTVFSPKGGAGTTTVATNLAINLQKILEEDVLLIDGKHLFGHIALYLNLLTGNSMTDLISQVGALDERLIKQVVVRHSSGIDVLPSPNSLADAQGIRPEDLYKIIQALQQVYPNIIIDGGNNLNENAVTYMDSSEKILVILNPDLASMRDAKQFMEISATLSYPKDKMLPILNLAGRKADIKLSEIEEILKMKIFGTIPADDNLAISSLNEGIPMVIKKPRHPISKAYKRIAKELVKTHHISKPT